MVCLLESNIEVQKQLKEYTDILGDAAAAYYVLSENNGYDLDKAPDGAESQLYKDLLDKYGSKELAIKKKAVMFSIPFKNRYNYQVEPTMQQILEYEDSKPSTDDIESFFDSNKDMEDMYKQKVQDFEEGMSYIDKEYSREEEEELNDALKNIEEHILNGLKAMSKSINDPDPAVNAKLKAQIDWQINNITQGLTSHLQNITEFLNNLRHELKPNMQFLLDSVKNGAIIDDKKLNDLDQNFFGFYCKMVDDILYELQNNESYRKVVGKDKKGNYILDKIVQKTKDYKQLLDDGNKIVQKKIVENARKNLQQVGLEVGDPTIYDYIRRNPGIDKDISIFTLYLGAGDKIKDTTIKSIFYLINQANRTAKANNYQVQLRLKQLLDAAGKYNQMQLFEVDDDGNPTGYLVRSRNYGKFIKNYQKEIDRIKMSLGIELSDLTLPENKEIRVKFNQLKNEWLAKHCERKFTKEYYDLFNELSEEAASARESVQIKIRSLMNKVKNEYGIPELERLTDEEWSAYQGYMLEKKQLASIYDINGVKKQGSSLAIAEELTKLNKSLSEGLKMQKNSVAFEKEKQRVMSSAELTKEQKQRWLDRNSKKQYKQEFYDKLAQIERAQYGKKYEEYSDRRRSILSQFRDDSTGNIDVDKMPASSKAAIAAIDRQMRNIRKNSKAKPANGVKFEEVAKVVPTDQWYRDLKAARARYIEDPEGFELWIAANAYYIKKGDKKILVPKSWYTKIVPVDDSMIEIVPNNNWLEISPDSEYYNKAYFDHQQKFEDSSEEYWIPKKQVKDDKGKVIETYDTESKLEEVQNNEALNNLRVAILEVLRESNSKLTNLNKTYPYRIPQVSGSVFRYIKAGWKRSGIVGAFKGIPQWWKDKLSVRNDDVGFNESLTKPNGEPLNMIPQYYLKQLDDPATITADLVGAVIKYHKSCESWKQNTLIQPKIEILKKYLKGRKFSNRQGQQKTTDTNMYKFAQEFINMNLYDIKNKNVSITYGDNPAGKLLGMIPYQGAFLGFTPWHYDISGKREINVTKLFSVLRALGTARNLALNIPCALTGFTTALHAHIINSLVSRYYNPVDAAYAFKDMTVDTLMQLYRGTGLPGSRKSKLTSLMEYFEVGATMELNPTNRNGMVNMLSKHWGFGLYSLSDHIIKGQILSAVMHNFKLVIDKDGNKRIMSREQYKTEFSKDTYMPGDIMDWNFGDFTSLYDLVEVRQGKIVAKDPENQQLVDSVKETVGNTARNLAQSADGQMTDMQRSILLSNFAGQFAMMHRQYLPVILQERYTMSRQYDYQQQRWREGVFRTPFRLFHEAQLQNKSILQTYKEMSKSDPLVRENMARIVYEIASYNLIGFVIRPFFQRLADEDRRNWLKQLLAYVIERTSFEVYAPYNLADMAKVVKDPSAILSYVQNMFELVQQPFSAMWNLGAGAIGMGKVERPVSRGAYRGMQKWEQNLWKATPFKNYIELQDIQSKRNYYQKQVLGE